MMKLIEDGKKRRRPLLILDRLPENFGNQLKNNKKNNYKLSHDEKILLTLIARIIVEIFIKEEL
ncbi:hypothetical protein D3C87_600290 [compost metagenome]